MEFKNLSQARKLAGFSYLGSINSSAKLKKNGKVSKQMTYILYLSPANSSGHNVCAHSTPECRLGCLASSGRVRMEVACEKTIIQSARIRKTRLFFDDQNFFMELLIAEIEAGQRKAAKNDYGFSARLNGTSDIEWEHVYYNGKNIFEIFPDVQFYDYCKNAGRLLEELPANYHLTYSHSGRNVETCKKVLSKGFNVAVVFNTKDANQFPAEWNGYPVINGDLTDYRPDDDKNSIVGLTWKVIANKETNDKIKNSVFVVNV